MELTSEGRSEFSLKIQSRGDYKDHLFMYLLANCMRRLSFNQTGSDKSIAVLDKHQWLLLPRPGSTLLSSSLTPGWGHSRSREKLWHGVNKARAFALLELGLMPGWIWETGSCYCRLLSVRPRGQPACAHSSRVESRLPTALLLVSRVLEPVKGLISPM